jgi:adenine-specific DNA-methyltransferase
MKHSNDFSDVFQSLVTNGVRYAGGLKNDAKSFGLHNRRYLGNKYKLLSFIGEIVQENCRNFDSVCDIFAGTGSVGEYFNKSDVKVISNDFLKSNYYGLSTFLTTTSPLLHLAEKINFLNRITTTEDNYFSSNFGNTFFTLENARKIGIIREAIDLIADSREEKRALVCSLIYAVDKVANTCGHYDAYRKTLDQSSQVKLSIPKINYKNNFKNEVYNEDANELIKNITADVLYIDPPYNSRQYSNLYHLLENLTLWSKPAVNGKAKKMDCSDIKSKYCTTSAVSAFSDLIEKADCKHILLSYNNTGNKKGSRSNARITDDQIMDILSNKGKVKVYEKGYKAFTTGKSDGKDNSERVFYCEVKR